MCLRRGQSPCLAGHRPLHRPHQEREGKKVRNEQSKKNLSVDNSAIDMCLNIVERQKILRIKAMKTDLARRERLQLGTCLRLLSQLDVQPIVQ